MESFTNYQQSAGYDGAFFATPILLSPTMPSCLLFVGKTPIVILNPAWCRFRDFTGSYRYAPG